MHTCIICIHIRFTYILLNRTAIDPWICCDIHMSDCWHLLQAAQNRIQLQESRKRLEDFELETKRNMEDFMDWAISSFFHDELELNDLAKLFVIFGHPPKK